MSRLPCLFSLFCLCFIGASCSENIQTGNVAPGEALQNNTPYVEVPNDSRAPDEYFVRVETSKGPLIVKVMRAWSPKGADRFYTLVNSKFYDETRFFRVVKGFVVQWGIHGNPDVQRQVVGRMIGDDPPQQSNRRGTITFATSGKHSRTTQVFINLRDNTGLDSQGFTPFGEVVEGMNVVESFYGGYNERPTGLQGQIGEGGNAFLAKHFPELDFIKTAKIADDPAVAARGQSPDETPSENGNAPPSEDAAGDPEEKFIAPSTETSN